MTFVIPAPALDRHIGIVGKTGSGKSNTGGWVEPILPDCAYAAGFFDGEGTVFIAADKGRKEARGIIYNMRVMASQVDPTPLAWFQERWGGSIVRRPGNEHRRPNAVWNCFAKQAAKFLKDIRPFLIVKADEADIAIAFQEAAFNPGCRGHTAAYRERQEQQRQLLMEMKRDRERLAI